MTGRSSHRFVNPPDVWDSTPHGFSQAVIAAPGVTIFVSGQVDWDANRTIGSDDLGGQAIGALASLGRVLAAAGASLADVTALRLYIVADADDDLGGVGDALRATFPRPVRDRRPRGSSSAAWPTPSSGSRSRRRPSGAEPGRSPDPQRVGAGVGVEAGAAGLVEAG